jgi:hemerythrin-like domain-containing protein
MTQMSMNKVIHGALRRDLGRFISALETFPAGSHTRARELATAWANFDDQLTYHHEGEHKIAWPALESVGVSQGLLATMDAEHDVMAKALAAAGSAMTELDKTATADAAGSALSAMRELQGVAVAHLDHEETELEPVYLSKRDTPEIQAMGKAFAKVSPTRGGRFFAWVMDGATPDERATITNQMPGPVLAVIEGVFGRSYRKNVATVWQ